MITRAQIRRQLRKDGGIMNVTPRQGYFLGKVVKAISKPFKKVVDVGKQVIKSPIGKAALIGLGGAGLMGIGPLGSTLGGFGARMGGSGIGQFFKGMGPKLFGQTPFLSKTAAMKGAAGFPGTSGILGKLGLTKGGGSLIPTALGGLTAAGLMTYFMSKGKPEEEAIKLAEDVKRGEGMGLDLIKADIKKYRSGALSGSQMFDKGYNFLLPRDYIGAKGGRVGLYAGTPKEGIKSLEAGASSIKVEGDVRPENMKMAKNISRRRLLEIYNDSEIEREMGPGSSYTTDELHKILLKLHGDIIYMAKGGRIGYKGGGGGPTGHSPSHWNSIIEAWDAYDGPMNFTEFYHSHINRAQGGRIGYKEGTKKIKSWPKGLQNLKYLISELIAGKGTDWRTGSEWYDKLSDEKIRDIIGGKTGKIYARDKGYLPKVLYDEPEEGRGYYLKAQGGRIGFNAGGSHKAWLTSKGYKDMMKGMSSAEITQLYDSVKGTWSKADGGRIGKYGGGIGAAMPRIPTGMPRVNAGGITELDYRSSGGFVPVGVKEKADDVPAMLSKNEFVMTADAVKAAGGGSVEKGAQKMYNTMKRLEGRIA